MYMLLSILLLLQPSPAEVMSIAWLERPLISAIVASTDGIADSAKPEFSAKARYGMVLMYQSFVNKMDRYR